EKFYIASHYGHFVTGNLEEARKSYELWAQTYPRDHVPSNNLAVIYNNLGDYTNALTRLQQTLKLNPGSGISYSNLVSAYLYLNRLDEARATAEKAKELSQRASESAQRADEKETAAGYQAEAALRAALVGDMAFAKQQAQTAL